MRKRRASEPAHPDGRRHAQAELLEDLADEAREEAYGEEDGEEAKGGRGHGGAHLARPLEYCLLEAKPHAAVAVNVFRHHDGVVHHDAHRHGEGEEADEVVGEAQNAEEEDGPGEGDGDGQDDGEDGVELPQEDEDHQGDGQGGQERLPHRVLHRGLDEAGGVQGDLRPVPGGREVSSRARLTSWATATALASGVLTTARTTAGRPFTRFRVVGASRASSTRATSRTRMPRPGSTRTSATSEAVRGVARRV